MASFFDTLCASKVTLGTNSEENCHLDGASMPNLYDEAREMLGAVLIINIFADLRQIARETSLPIDNFNPPLSSNEMLSLINSNKAEICRRSCKNADLEEKLLVLKRLKWHTPSSSGFIKMVFGTKITSSHHLIRFEDVNAGKQRPHAILVNETQQSITVVFCGCVAQEDFKSDTGSDLVKVPNPVLNSSLKIPTIKLHTGFSEYLLKKNTSEEKCRLDCILQDLKDLLKKYPGYRVYFTGHSLGAALSTLCGFYAATHNDIIAVSGPIQIFSIASPLIGNRDFLLAFQCLEREGRLQHLRICKEEDMITLLPFETPKLRSPISLKGKCNLYMICGMQLLLTDKSETDSPYPYKLYFPQDQNGCEDYAEEVKTQFEGTTSSFKLLAANDFKKLMEHHSYKEYEMRLDFCKDALSHFTIDDLYHDKDITGNIMDKDYEPTTQSFGKIGKRLIQRSTKLMQKAVKDVARKHDQK